MLNIAICDDEAVICRLYQEKVQNIMDQQGIPVKISIFSNPKEFLEGMKNRRNQLLLLDIDMPGISGLEIAEKMQGLAAKPLIIFVTNQDALVYQTFQYHPFGFIRKSFLEEELAGVLGQAVQELRNRQVKYIFKFENQTTAIRLSDLMYLEAEGNYLMLHTKEQVYRIRDTMARAEKELEDRGFVRIHKGFLVNQEAVYRIGNDEITLMDRTVLPIGRSNKEQAKERLMRFLMA